MTSRFFESSQPAIPGGLNPLALEGQIQGAILQGLGYGLIEEFEPGKTDSLRDYGFPDLYDVPEMVVLFVGDEVPPARLAPREPANSQHPPPRQSRTP